ncbi:MAG: amidophosphoribosyltransferase [Thermonemataceae bacterium]|nr:amidophosphoribosyltransferase [Thermonemataceae bacterium]
MCGIAFIRLRKPYQYYLDKYGSALYPLQKLYIMMEKQSNRGQDGAGVATIKLDVEPGVRYISRYRSTSQRATQKIFKKISKRIQKSTKNNKKEKNNAEWLKSNVAFTGEVLLGHLRYGTHGLNTVENCHPFLRQNNWRSRNLVLAGNFNMTNNDELFDKLLQLGQHPKEKIDTVTVLEKIGHFLDEENQRIYDNFKGEFSKQAMSPIIEEQIDLQRVLKRACKDFDGGYAIAGITGFGSAFVARDPAGIRPAYFWANDEFVVAASERTAIKLAFDAEYDTIQEIPPAKALIVHKNGDYEIKSFAEPTPLAACSFERIYFSRGTDPKIYTERKKLGFLLAEKVLETIKYDLENTVFSYVPNTAETAFLGLLQGLESYLAEKRKLFIQKQDWQSLENLSENKIRVEKLVVKDAKLRTFITDDSHRNEMVNSVYDTTQGLIRKNIDTLVITDDSIVRGTTLEKSILKMLDKLAPKKIVVVSSAPQIRYPDCYGIDMSRIKDFIAFRAALELLEEQNKGYLLEEIKEKIKENNTEDTNWVKMIYEPFSDEEISDKIAQMLRREGIKAEVAVIYQSVDNLHKACTEHTGDWYFTGNYPTLGGYRVVNKALENFLAGKLERAY